MKLKRDATIVLFAMLSLLTTACSNGEIGTERAEFEKRTLINLSDEKLGGDASILICKRAENGVTFSVVQVGVGEQTKFRVFIDDQLKPYEGIVLGGSPIFGLKGEHIAYSVMTDKKQRFIIDDIPQPAFDGVGASSLKFNPSGRGHAYFAQNNGQWRAVVNGKSGPLMDSTFTSTLKYSADGNHIAYAGSQDGKTTVYLDGKPVGTYDEIHSESFAFNANGQLGFIAGVNQTYFAVVDKKRYGDFARINREQPLFSPDGKRFAVAGATDEEAWAVIDGQKTQSCSAIGSIDFTDDSQHTAYGVTQQIDGKWIQSMIFDGIRQVVDGRCASPPFMRSNGKPFFRYELDGEWYLIDDKEKYGPFDGFFDNYSMVGETVGLFAGVRNKKVRVYVDGKPGPSFDHIGAGGALVAPRTEAVAYAGVTKSEQADQVQIVHNCKSGIAFNAVGAGSIKFSSNGQRLCYIGINGNGSQVVLNEATDSSCEPTVTYGPTCDKILGIPTFSEDGRHLAYICVEGAAQRMIIDGKKDPPVDQIAADSEQFKKQEFSYVALEGSKLIVVTHSLCR